MSSSNSFPFHTFFKVFNSFLVNTETFLRTQISILGFLFGHIELYLIICIVNDTILCVSFLEHLSYLWLHLLHYYFLFRSFIFCLILNQAFQVFISHVLIVKADTYIIVTFFLIFTLFSTRLFVLVFISLNSIHTLVWIDLLHLW